MSEQLNVLVEVAGEHARMVLIELGKKSLMPTWVLINPDGKFSIIGTPWRNDLEKVAAKAEVRKLIKKQRIVAYSFVSEAWTATKPLGWTPTSDPHFVRPRDDPERREVVIAIATDGKTKAVGAWAIQRDESERVRALEPLPDPGLDVFGSMTELLDD